MRLKQLLYILINLVIVFLSEEVRSNEIEYSISYTQIKNYSGTEDFKSYKFIALDAGEKLPFSSNQYRYLFRLKLKSPAPGTGFVVEIDNEHINNVSLYIKQHEKFILKGKRGNDYQYQNPQLGMPKFTILEQPDEFYLLVSFNKEVSLNIKLVPLSNYTAEGDGTWTYLKVGLYYGIATIVFFINMSLFLVFRERIFLYYCSFQLFIVLSIFYSDSLFTMLTSNPFLLNQLDIPLHLGIVLSGFLFSRAFLSHHFPDFFSYKALIIIISAIFILYVINITTGNYYAFFIAELIAFATLTSYWLIALSQIKKSATARLFIAAYGIYIFFAIDYYVLRKIGIEVLHFTSGQLKIGSFIEMMVLSAITIIKVNEIRKENQNYRNQIEETVRNESIESSGIDDNSMARIKLKYDLTDREKDVLIGLKDGLTNVQIAQKLFISVNTVKFHTRNIFNKMSINNRNQVLKLIYE